jgi:hypothetical protein
VDACVSKCVEFALSCKRANSTRCLLTAGPDPLVGCTTFAGIESQA